METVTDIVLYGIAWSRSVLGLVTRPYETYRRIANHSSLGELGIMAAFSALYFMLASVVKVASFHPFLLTGEFLRLAVGAAIGYGAVVTALWVASRLVGARVAFTRMAVSWGYTMIPTALWFYMTSLLYVIVPPPRTTSVLGVAFSAVFLVMSATLLWWKLMLSYLTIRFTTRFPMTRIIAVGLLVTPVFVADSIIMYRLGIFKIPYL